MLPLRSLQKNEMLSSMDTDSSIDTDASNNTDSSSDTDSLNESTPQGIDAPIDSPYTPLNRDTGQFRLLYLEPGRHDDEIRIQLTPVRLVCPPWYEALSYVWGTKLAPFQLVANGKCRIAITENLDCALRHLRQPKGTRVL